jgi:hypothetical protein
MQKPGNARLLFYWPMPTDHDMTLLSCLRRKKAGDFRPFSLPADSTQRNAASAAS